jgi:hypothetical protein
LVDRVKSEDYIVGIISNEVKYYPEKILAKNVAFTGGEVEAIKLNKYFAKDK